MELDPHCGLPQAGLSTAYVFLGATGNMPQSEAYPEAEAAATRALALEESAGEAHSAMALVHLFQHRDWPSAYRSFQKALTLTPGLELISGATTTIGSTLSADSLVVAGSTALNANVSTTGTQQYGDDATADVLTIGGNRTLSGTTVTITSVVPRSRCNSTNKSINAAPVCESSAPVGSSASKRRG